MGRSRKINEKRVRFTIRRKIITLAICVMLPFVVMLGYLLRSMANYSRRYDNIVSSMTVANNYNLNFKDEMDESLYKLVVGYVDFETIGSDSSLKDPYVLIRELRQEFTQLLEQGEGLPGEEISEESKFWLQSLLRNIDTLEKRVDDIKTSLEEDNNYDQNIEMLDNNIYILTELIQDDIQYYIYYQTQSMELVSESLKEQMHTFVLVSEIAVLILVASAILVSILIVTGMMRPMESLYQATEKMAGGDFSARAEVSSNDEISVVAEGFNNLAQNMETLIQEIKEDEQKMRKADLRLLQEQINPHFLYNTLDTIVWLIEANETDQATNMVVTLSNFFRIVLSKGKEYITIREEEQHIKSYLDIQSMRYHDIMEYDIQIDQVLYRYQIPKLTLQPIVENALYHGLKVKRAKGYIHILGEKEGNIIRLIVRDNGVGMEEAELEELRQEIARPCQETERGFGLANVNERIRMYFGTEYGMTIRSTKGKGTEVEVIIPAILPEKEVTEP